MNLLRRRHRGRTSRRSLSPPELNMAAEESGTGAARERVC